MKKTLLFLLVFYCFMPTLAAVNSQYTFHSIEKKQRFDRLTAELRCMVCQNETLADSTASFASDLRGDIYQMVESGKSEQEIKRALVSRYGNFILFKPPLIQETYLLWLAPLLLLTLGVGLVFYMIRKYRS